MIATLVVGVLLLRVASAHRSDQARNGTPTTWSRYTLDGDRLRVEFEGSPCQDSSELTLDEDADRVVATLHLRASDQVCVSLAVGHDAETQLRSPLGTRRVYDGACLQRSDVPDDPACQRASR